jgi:uridine kinase
MIKKAFLIGICGRSGSGKSTFAKRLQQSLRDMQFKVGLMNMDDYYSELSEEDHQQALAGNYDFDCLEAFDLDRLRDNIEAASQGRSVAYSKYDHANHKHDPSSLHEYEPAQVWIVEGLYLFAVPGLMDLFNLRIFMEVDADDSLLRRVRRDIVSRRRDVASVLEQYERYVKPAYELIVAPSRSKADICVMRGAFNDVAFSLVLNSLKALNL